MNNDLVCLLIAKPFVYYNKPKIARHALETKKSHYTNRQLTNFYKFIIFTQKLVRKKKTKIQVADVNCLTFKKIVKKKLQLKTKKEWSKYILKEREKKKL